MYNDQVLYRIYFDFLKLIQNFSTSGSILYTLNTLIRDKSKLKLHRELGLHGLAWADLSWSNHSNHHTDKNLVSTNSSWTARYLELNYEWISFDISTNWIRPGNFITEQDDFLAYPTCHPFVPTNTNQGTEINLFRK